jgi:DNA-binding transcriptional MerR regulator
MNSPLEQETAYLSIQEVAQATGIAPSTIRFYDQQFEEYLRVKRGPGRRRLFSSDTVERLINLHRLLKEDGLSIRQARQTLAGQGSGPLGHPDLAGLQAEIKRLDSELTALKQQVQELKDIQRRTLGLMDGLTRS